MEWIQFPILYVLALTDFAEVFATFSAVFTALEAGIDLTSQTTAFIFVSERCLGHSAPCKFSTV